jgi:hypothetical protein
MRQVDGVLHNVHLVIERRRDFDGGVSDDQRIGMAWNVHDETMADRRAVRMPA